MHYYCERHLTEVILVDNPVKFDKELDVSIAFGPEFINDGEGVIDILTAGYYMVKWSTVSMTGFSTDAPWFELKFFDEECGGWSPLTKPDGGTVTLLSANSSGFVPFEVSEAWLNTYGRYRIALFNISGTSLTLSQFLAVKASLIIYGVPYFDKTVSQMLELLQQYEEECCAIELERQISEREVVGVYQFERLNELEQFKSKVRGAFDAYYETWKNTTLMVFPSKFMRGTTLVDGFPGIEICVRKVGYSYTFFFRGTLTGTPTYDSTSGNFWFVDSTTCPIWSHLKHDVRFAVPVFWESSTTYGDSPGLNVNFNGIYLQTTALPTGSTSIGVAWRSAFTCYLVENS